MAANLTITQDQDGTWRLRDGDKPISAHATNAEAWKAYDRLMREPVSKAEDRTDWFVTKMLRSWP